MSMSAKSHREIKLFVNNLQSFGDACLPHSTKAIKEGSTDIAALSAQCTGFENILTTTNPTVHVNFNLASESINNGRKRIDARVSAVELASSVITHDQRISTRVN